MNNISPNQDLDESRLEVAIMETKENLANGRYKVQTVEEHLKDLMLT